MSLKDLLKSIPGAQEATVPGGSLEEPYAEPYYEPKHWQWLGRAQRQWSPQALEFARNQLAGLHEHPRNARISPSSLGDNCERALLFGYGGAPKIASTPKAEASMQSGTMEHLKWQMEGLSFPYLSEAEIWVHDEGLRCGGSADGRGIDSSLFELKNTAPHLFAAIAKGPEYLHAALAKERAGTGSAAAYAAHMVRKHKLQMEAYWLVDSLQTKPMFTSWGSLVYQNKESFDVYEIRLQSDPGRRRQVHRILEGLHDWIDLNQLPDMLDGCAATAGFLDRSPTEKEKTVFDRCGYRQWCPSANQVTTQ